MHSMGSSVKHDAPHVRRRVSRAEAVREPSVCTVALLEVDPDLARPLDPDDAATARRFAVAELRRIAPGLWRPADAFTPQPDTIGLLMGSGLMSRNIILGGRWCTELLGPGDLLRPWEDGSAGVLVSCDVRWHVLEEAQLAILGRGFAIVAARWPALTSALVARAVGRSHALALSATISSTTGLETRLLMLFWHLADRWGKVRRDGVVVPVQMTHELIARLIGARRPSVSTALKRLERDALITRLNGTGWLLGGPPPKSVLRHESECGGAASAGDAAPPQLELISRHDAGPAGDGVRDDTRGSGDAAALRAEPANMLAQVQAGVRRRSAPSRRRGTGRRRAGALRA